MKLGSFRQRVALPRISLGLNDKSKVKMKIKLRGLLKSDREFELSQGNQAFIASIYKFMRRLLN